MPKRKTIFCKNRPKKPQIVRSEWKRRLKVRIYPSVHQEERLNHVVDLCCILYNAALSERRKAFERYLRFKDNPKFIKCWPNFAYQYDQLIESRDENPWLKELYAETATEVLKRLDNSMKRFIERKKSVTKVGLPRFKNRATFETFAYPHGNRAVTVHKNTLTVTQIGSLRFHNGKNFPIPGNFIRVEISHVNNAWYVLFEYERDPVKMLKELDERNKKVRHGRPKSTEKQGGDPGGINAMTFSSGKIIKALNTLEKFAARLIELDRKISRSRPKKGCKKSNHHKKLLAQRRSLWAHIYNKRQDSQNKMTRHLVDKHYYFILEDTDLQSLMASKTTSSTPDTTSSDTSETSKTRKQEAHIHKMLADVGIGGIYKKLSYKAVEAGGWVKKVPAYYSSQTCSRCGRVDSQSRVTQSRFVCTSCGFEVHADINASRVIRSRYIDETKMGAVNRLVASNSNGSIIS